MNVSASTSVTSSDNSMAAKIFHPLLALIASASNNELARYVEFLKEENKILRARIPGQIHTKPEERSRLVKLGKAFGSVDRRNPHENEEISSVVAPVVAFGTVENGCQRLITVDAADADLARLVKAWPTLNAAARRMVLAVVDAAQETDQ